MHHGPIIFLGAFFVLASSWFGLLVIPQMQLGGQQAIIVASTGSVYPAPRPGLAVQGEVSYRANGCIYCHTQQVRPEHYGADIKRNWGQRRTVSLDYLRDAPVMLGTMRTGPDLANIGMRQPDTVWHLLHLYDPQITSQGSIMPPHRFLFEKKPVGKVPSPDALQIAGAQSPGAGYEIVPTAEAMALVAYLKSLKSNAPIPEHP